MYVELKNINKTYGSYQASRNVNFGIEKGKLIGLLGPSGSGKTTILRMIAGLETPDSGTIDGLKNLKISAVFQEDRLLEGYDVLTNLRFVCRQRLSDAELSAYAAALLPQNALFQPVCEFSGGMKRRLSLLRALLVPFDLLILDEPFNGLEPQKSSCARPQPRTGQNSSVCRPYTRGRCTFGCRNSLPVRFLLFCVNQSFQRN